VEAVKEILEREGVTSSEDLDIHDSFNYDGGEHHYNLAIEKVYEDTLSVEQHYTQRMDRMSAPEIRFDISDYDDWVPIEYTNHDTVPQIYERDEDGLDLDGFLNTWNKNLKEQFPADEVTDRGENR
jgi:hypothetical protein